MGRPTQYTVSLSQEEKEKLLSMSKDNNLSARVSKRVLILQALDNKFKSQTDCFCIEYNCYYDCGNSTQLFSEWPGFCNFPSL